MGWKVHTFALLMATMFLTHVAGAAVKVHVITFGKWTTVQWETGLDEQKAVHVKTRALIVDGRVKEYFVGAPHEVTDRLFVVHRVFRVNDSLPEDSTPRWKWQRGGWMLVDRMSGRISAINLPEYDPLYSAASWYRDYVAYCGVADDGKKVSAIVAQLSRRKPALKKAIAEALPDDAEPDSACAAPAWQRAPARVTFPLATGKQTFAIRGRVVDLVNDAEEEEEKSGQ